MSECPCICRIELVVEDVPDIVFDIEDEAELIFEMGDAVIHTSDVPYYDGETDITPMLDTVQTLGTEGKQLRSDVIVRQIPITITSNPYGGKTALIG